MENKLIEGIESAIVSASWMECEFREENKFEDKNNFREINSRIAGEKLFTLTSDVAVKFAEWHNTALLKKEALVWFKENNVEFNIHSSFLYFIEHIYPALDKNLNK